MKKYEVITALCINGFPTDQFWISYREESTSSHLLEIPVIENRKQHETATDCIAVKSADSRKTKG